MTTLVAEHGAYHMSDNPGAYEIHRSSTFQLIVPGINRLLKPGADGTAENDYIKNGQDIIRLTVKTASIPDPTIAVESVRRGNSVMKVAGLPSYDDGSITLTEFEGTDAANVLYAWKQLAYNQSTDLTGRMSNYKKECTLIEYDVDYTHIIRQYTLKGCWVSSIQRSNLNVEEAGPREITATIPFDRARMTLSDTQ